MDRDQAFSLGEALRKIEALTKKPSKARFLHDFMVHDVKKTDHKYFNAALKKLYPEYKDWERGPKVTVEQRIQIDMDYRMMRAMAAYKTLTEI